MGEYSAIVAEGMKRACSDFTEIVAPLGFKRGKRRTWERERAGITDKIFISRSGSSYGAPHSPSVTLQISLARHRTADDSGAYLDHHMTGKLRRSTGYGYHYRFNAETGSTYDRCLEELQLFMEEVAEPWFQEAHGAAEN